MSRRPLDYVRDILEAMHKALEFVEDMDYSAFVQDDKTNFATVRALEVMGEAAKNVPDELRSRFPDIPWGRMAGIRDVLIHGYFGVDIEVVWKTLTVDIPSVIPKIDGALEIATPQLERAMEFIDLIARDLTFVMRHGGYDLGKPGSIRIGFVRFNIGGKDKGYYRAYAYSPFSDPQSRFVSDSASPTRGWTFVFHTDDEEDVRYAVSVLESSYDQK